jgi:hypothetical protein
MRSRCVWLTTLSPSVSRLSRQSLISHNPIGLHGLLRTLLSTFYSFQKDLSMKPFLNQINPCHSSISYYIPCQFHERIHTCSLYVSHLQAATYVSKGYILYDSRFCIAHNSIYVRAAFDIHVFPCFRISDATAHDRILH